MGDLLHLFLDVAVVFDINAALRDHGGHGLCGLGVGFGYGQANISLPITLPFKIVLAMVAMACFYFGRKYYHNHKNGGAETPSMSSAESEALASGILKALGGKNNIVKVDYCATRLRFEVHSYASVDEAAAKAAGAEGVIRPAKNACQVVIKGDVQAVYDALRKQL